MGSTEMGHVYFGMTQSLLPEFTEGRRVIVITDENVKEFIPNLLYQYEHIIIAPGEQSKSLETVEYIYSELIRMGADRHTLLIGVGGGVVTDITGFVASTFMRGIDFGFVATSLLAQVDAAIGGKNGINLGGYKNMVGTFRHPKFVICDLRVLDTLPESEFRSGVAEVIKAAIIASRSLFDELKSCDLDYYRFHQWAFQPLMALAVNIKLDIVIRDERESGLRRVLNLGHTIAHAIENRADNHYSHGEAVAIGIAMVTRMAAKNGLLDPQDAEEIVSLLKYYGFEVDYPFTTDLMEAISKDKKREDGLLHLIVPTAIGKVKDMAVTLEELERMFNK